MNASFRCVVAGFVNNVFAVRVVALAFALAVALVQPMGPIAGGGGI